MAQFPLINGMYFSWADVEATTTIVASGQPFTFVGVKAINYKASLSKQKVRGTASVSIGLTKGKYEATGDVEFYLPQANLLISTLGPGWMQSPITFQVSYVSSGPLGAPGSGLPQTVITDTIPPCFLTEMDASQSEGDEPLTRKFTLTIPGQILFNGIPSIVEPALLIAIA
jgi:hypothetical protein